jgi:hypothetical protein
MKSNVSELDYRTISELFANASVHFSRIQGRVFAVHATPLIEDVVEIEY